MADNDAQERRRSFRVHVPAEALLWRSGQFAGRYQLEDLSIGGCRLSDGPTRPPGDPVEVLIRMPHHGALSLAATVVRRAIRGHHKASLGLSFATPSATAEDWIHDVVLWALEAARPGGPRTGLVVMDDPQEASKIVRHLRQMGRSAIAAHTPLDAIQLLVEQGERVDVVLMEESLSGGRGLEIANFLAANHPSVHRVMLGRQERLPSMVQAHSCGTVESILTLPAAAEELEDVLQTLGCWMPLSPSGANAKC